MSQTDSARSHDRNDPGPFCHECALHAQYRMDIGRGWAYWVCADELCAARVGRCLNADPRATRFDHVSTIANPRRLRAP